MFSFYEYTQASQILLIFIIIQILQIHIIVHYLGILNMVFFPNSWDHSPIQKVNNFIIYFRQKSLIKSQNLINNLILVVLFHFIKGSCILDYLLKYQDFFVFSKGYFNMIYLLWLLMSLFSVLNKLMSLFSVLNKYKVIITILIFLVIFYMKIKIITVFNSL